MNIEWFRDLVVCIFGLGTVIAVVFMAVLAFLVYRQIMPTLVSLKRITRTVEDLSTCVEEEVAGPLSQVVAFVQGINQAVNLVRHFAGRKKED
ncbi:MAG: hypothetical protein A2144_13395 [Chloroflexi bacterium RBG_16_50_9]|nr:MAG: hypothetical protein A2144_13395 [Chloroflexi bacterium RBG_16_50_9]